MKNWINTIRPAFVAAMFLVAVTAAPLAEAARGGHAGGGHAAGGGGGQRAAGGAKARPQANNTHVDKRTNNVRNASVNNVNVNRNVNVNVEGNRGGCCNNGWDNDYHPVATAAAITATVAVTSAIVGSIVNAPPAGCVPVNYGGVIYQQCGSTWYQPQGAQYVVIGAPY